MSGKTPAYAVMKDRLVLQSPAPVSVRVSSLTRVSTTATATTIRSHGYTTGDYVTIAGALPAGYNGTVAVTVTGPTTITYAVADTLTTPASGAISATYASDAQGGRVPVWTTIDTIWAELVPVKAWERLQAAAIQTDRTYRFRIRARTDVAETWRVLWTPAWPSGAAVQTLEVTGVTLDGDGRQFLFLECGKAPGV